MDQLNSMGKSHDHENIISVFSNNQIEFVMGAYKILLVTTMELCFMLDAKIRR